MVKAVKRPRKKRLQPKAPPRARKGGHPATPENERHKLRGLNIQIKATPEERERVQRQAKEEGFPTFSDWARMRLGLSFKAAGGSEPIATDALSDSLVDDDEPPL